MFEWLKDKKHSANGTDYFQLRPVMERLLQSHGVRTSNYKEWVLGGTDLPAIRASLQNTGRSETTRLDVELCIAPGQTIIESFGGVGKDAEQATNDAVENFCKSSLHVFLAAFWNHVEPDQVTLENWEISGASWSAYIGSQVCRGTDAFDVPVPADVFPLTEMFIKKLLLRGDLHWVRTFYCNVKDQQKTSEALLDNNVWTDLQDAARHLKWPPTDKFYSVRNFLILKKSC